MGIFSSTCPKRNTRKDALNYANDFALRSYVVVVSYEMVQDGEDGNGIKYPKKVSATATYLKRHGKWYSKFYREVILEK